MKSQNLIKIITVLVFVIVIGAPLFYTNSGVYPYILSKELFFQAAVEILFFFWLLLAVFDKRYRPKMTPLVLGLAVFLLALGITAAFGVDPARSFWSTYERMFGVFTILHLAAFFLVLSSLHDELSWKKIFYASLGTGFVIDVLAILQLQVKNLLLEEPVGARPGATFGNPTFLAGYILFNIFLGVYLILSARKAGNLPKNSDKLPSITANFNKLPSAEILLLASPTRLASRAKRELRRSGLVFLFATLILNVFTLFLSETRGDILGVAVGAFVLLLLFFLRPPELKSRLACALASSPTRRSGPAKRVGFLRKRGFYAAALFLIIAASLGFWFTRSSPLWSRVPGLARFHDISLTSEGLLPRLAAARSAWRGFLDRPVLGWGWDNFNIVYNKYYDPRTLELSYQETRFDKPHNFFLEDLVSGGLLLALAHLALIGLLVFEALKIKNKLLGQVVVAAVAAYFIRSLFIFDTLGPALMLYLFMGLIDGRYRKETNHGGKVDAAVAQTPSHDGPAKIGASAAVLTLIVAIVVAYEVNVPTFNASYYDFRGFIDLSRGRAKEGIENFNKSISFPSPYRWNFARDLSAAVTQAYFYNQDAIPKEAALRGIEEMEKVTADHPLDAYNHYVLVDMYNQVSDIDPQRFLEAAEREAKIALELSPDRQEVYFSMAKTKAIKKDYKAAIEVLKKALDLDPKVADAHFYYGLVSFALGDYDVGYKEIKIAMDMGRKWKNFYESRTVAGYFADAGHLDEAIVLYKTTLGLNNDDLETKIKLGIAYFFAGDHALAQKYLGEAGKKFNFKESASYGELKPILEKLGLD